MVIDFRVRPPYKSFLKSSVFQPRKPNFLQKGREEDRSPITKSMTDFMKEMDEAGIDKAVVVGRMEPRVIVPNSEVQELVRTYGDRFVGVGGLDGRNGQDALDEIDRIADMGLHGVAFDNGMCGLRNDDERLLPLYDKCRQAGLVVFLTTSIYVGPNLTYSDPAAIQVVARQFSDLKIAIPHAAWPWTVAMCAVALQCPNVYLVPDFYLNVPDLPGSEEYVKVANTHLEDRLIYASSYPVRPLGQSVRQFRSLKFDNEIILNKCLSGNARSLIPYL